VSDRKYPPFTELGMLSLALIVIGGIDLSSHIPQHVPLGVPIALLIASVAVMAVNFALLRRVEDFAWGRFRDVGKWTLLAYIFVAAMIEYTFLRNHLKGGPLVILTLSLIVFALSVPSLIAFTVARWDNPVDAPASTRA
jgi:hypothetical protein